MTPSTGERKRLLLTGASGKFGAAFIALCADRFDIVALAHSRGVAANTQNTILFDPVSGARSPRRVTELRCDLADSAATSSLLHTVIDIGGPIGYLVNAAADARFLGATYDAPRFEQDALRQWRVNVMAPMLLASILFHRGWKDAGVSSQDAAVLNISSISGRSVFKATPQATYAATKAALDMATLYMAAEYQRYGVRVNGLAPVSFPREVPTHAVAEAALKILQGRGSGKVYTLGPKGTTTNSVAPAAE